nr:immunoglobulin light chain junction region [Macaca mulatta]
CQHGYGVPYNF